MGIGIYLAFYSVVDSDLRGFDLIAWLDFSWIGTSVRMSNSVNVSLDDEFLL